MSRLNRVLLQQLADQYIEDAAILLEKMRWPAAYYLAGYSVECALKACIAKRTNAHDFPDKKLANEIHTHKLKVLLKVAELDQPRLERSRTSRDFILYWHQVELWSEESRYDLKGERQANELIQAISDNKEGVLPWIKLYW